MTNKIFKKALEQVSPEAKAYIAISMAIAARIGYLLEQKNWSGADLARTLDKSPSEVSRWLSGTHNFTLETLAKLETVFGEPILRVETLGSQGRDALAKPEFSVVLTDKSTGKVFEGMVAAL